MSAVLSAVIVTRPPDANFELKMQGGGSCKRRGGTWQTSAAAAELGVAAVASAATVVAAGGPPAGGHKTAYGVGGAAGSESKKPARSEQGFWRVVAVAEVGQAAIYGRRATPWRWARHPRLVVVVH